MGAAARVSVVVTCFNLGAYLPEALESIYAQTFRDLEICVVDDGSTDEATERVLREVAGRVAVVRTDNRGLSAARNIGVSRTAGEYLCVVDADDILLPTLVERSVERLDANPSVAFVSHWLEAFGDESWEWKPERCDFPSLLDFNTVNGAALVRRAAVDAVGGWDEDMRDGCEDWDFWITLVEQGFCGEIIPEILFRYRRRPDSMSRVKFAGGGLPRLYGRLVDKHAEAFRPYLQALAIRREVDTAGNRALADDLEGRLELEVLPALARARDDLMVAERQRSQWVQQQQLQAEAALLREQSSVSREEVASLRERLEAARTEAAHLQDMHTLARNEAVALRASWSWRLMRPFRALGTIVNRAAGRRP